MTSKRDKFVLAEMFSNEDGKTSASGFVGILIGITGCLAFFVAIVGYVLNLPFTIDVMQQSTLFIGAATALLGARKITGNLRNSYSNRSMDYDNDNDPQDPLIVQDSTTSNSKSGNAVNNYGSIGGTTVKPQETQADINDPII